MAARGAYDRNAVIFELVQIGGTVKVTAIDPASFTEVTTVGSPKVSESELKRLALRKLEYVLNKRASS